MDWLLCRSSVKTSGEDEASAKKIISRLKYLGNASVTTRTVVQGQPEFPPLTEVMVQHAVHILGGLLTIYEIDQYMRINHDRVECFHQFRLRPVF